jgi:hypothetical protein
MTQLAWDNVGERYFEAGVDRGVLYPPIGDGVPWNGLISVDESPSGGDITPYFIDGIKYINRSAAEEFEATIEAYTYPEEFAQCDGSAELYQSQGLFATQQKRRPFGLSYRTLIGNDVNAEEHAYKLHIIYNALAEPSKRTYQTTGEDTEPTTFSWDISTTIVPVPGVENSAHLVIDTRQAWPWAVAAVEAVLYGTEDTPPRLPTPQELVDLFVENAFLKITDNGDGTWTAEGPDEAISMLNATEFQISWPSAVYLDTTTYEISSL